MSGDRIIGHGRVVGSLHDTQCPGGDDCRCQDVRRAVYIQQPVFPRPGILMRTIKTPPLRAHKVAVLRGHDHPKVLTPRNRGLDKGHGRE